MAVYQECSIHHQSVAEAKVHTSWVRPYEEYEKAVWIFLGTLLRQSNRFLEDFDAFASLTSKAGLFNSLSQAVLKISSPGDPDFYQGTEVIDLSLVDPDNRRPFECDTSNFIGIDRK